MEIQTHPSTHPPTNPSIHPLTTYSSIYPSVRSPSSLFPFLLFLHLLSFSSLFLFSSFPFFCSFTTIFPAPSFFSFFLYCTFLPSPSFLLFVRLTVTGSHDYGLVTTSLLTSLSCQFGCGTLQSCSDLHDLMVSASGSPRC